MNYLLITVIRNKWVDYVFLVFCFPSGFTFSSEVSKEHEICCELQISISVVALSWLVGFLALHERRTPTPCPRHPVLMLGHLTFLRSCNSSSVLKLGRLFCILIPGKDNDVRNNTTLNKR